MNRRLATLWVVLAGIGAVTVMLVEPSRPIALAQPRTAETADPGASEPALPPARTHYKGRQIARFMSHEGADWLTRPEREREEHTARLHEALKLRAGMTVCDLGCGNGYWTLRMAETVGEGGWVYAVDIQPEMLGMLNERALAAGVGNYSPVLGTIIDPRLPPGSCDLVLLVDAYHEFSHPQLMLAAIRRALKPSGRLALVEYRAEDPSVPIKPLHKMSKEQIMKELPPNGFKLVGQFDGLPWQHVMFFQRDDGPDPAVEPTPWPQR